MPKHIEKVTKRATTQQIGDSDPIDNGSSSDDSVSLENYLDTNDETEEKVSSEST